MAPPSGTFDIDGVEGLGARFLEAAHIVVEASDWAVIKRFVEEGFGVALVPALCLLPGDRFARVAVEGQIRALSYGVFGRPVRSLPALARRFVEALDHRLARSRGGRSGGAARSSAKPSRNR